MIFKNPDFNTVFNYAAGSIALGGACVGAAYGPTFAPHNPLLGAVAGAIAGGISSTASLLIPGTVGGFIGNKAADDLINVAGLNNSQDSMTRITAILGGVSTGVALSFGAIQSVINSGPIITDMLSNAFSKASLPLAASALTVGAMMVAEKLINKNYPDIQP
jgi:hypothetical protein